MCVAYAFCVELVLTLNQRLVYRIRIVQRPFILLALKRVMTADKW